MRVLISAVMVLGLATSAAAQPAPVRYEAALAREKQVRASDAGVRVLRQVIAQYEAIVRRYPSSGYSDNALWQAAGLAQLAFVRYGHETDRRTAIRLLDQLRRGYPSSTLAKQVPGRLSLLNAPASAAGEKTAAATADRPAGSTEARADAPTASPNPPPAPHASGTRDAEPAKPTAPAAVSARLLSVSRSALPAGERITINLDAEPKYHEERIVNPDRLFFDFRNTAAADGVKPSIDRLVGGVVKDVRLGRQPDQTTRLVIELEPNTKHKVFALYNPYRVVVDLERTVSATAGAAADPAAENAVSVSRSATPVTTPPPPPTPAAAPATPPPSLSASVPARPGAIREVGAPVQPSVNSNGSFSLARQLGLGVARIVIDAGHGGHDPGAIAFKTSEAAITLDIALRLEKLLLQQPGIDVVLTRRTDVFVPLEERTAIANRHDADLFLSIHANVGRNASARGVETYFLNFAPNPEAEAIAARENAGSGMAMHVLPDIVRKIALNNKLDESRDFARVVQASLYRRIRQQNAQAKDRGVKQAPFVVLIGAQMPSVLAEVSFLTNKQEAALLKTPAYRQRIAQALFDAIGRYRQSLKKVGTVAAGVESR